MLAPTAFVSAVQSACEAVSAAGGALDETADGLGDAAVSGVLESSPEQAVSRATTTSAAAKVLVTGRSTVSA